MAVVLKWLRLSWVVRVLADRDDGDSRGISQPLRDATGRIAATMWPSTMIEMELRELPLSSGSSRFAVQAGVRAAFRQRGNADEHGAGVRHRRVACPVCGASGWFSRRVLGWTAPTVTREEGFVEGGEPVPITLLDRAQPPGHRVRAGRREAGDGEAHADRRAVPFAAGAEYL